MPAGSARRKIDYSTNGISRMEVFHLHGKEYIELNKLLKLLHLAGSGGEANTCIENGEVLVNGIVELRKRNKLRNGNEVVFRDRKIVIEA